MIEYLMSPLITLYIVGSFMAALNPAEQRDRASFATARSNVLVICRAQAVCMVENDPSECNSFEAVYVTNPQSPDWNYSFEDTGTEYSKAMAQGTLSGTNFTITCTNDRHDPNYAKAVCFDDGAGAGSCATFEAN